jgi:hypothetical protein
LIRYVDLVCAVLAIATIGVGVWWHDPGFALVVVGGIILALSVLSATRKVKQDD